MKQKLFDFNFEYKIRDSIKKSVKCFAVFLLINVCYAFTDSYSQTKTFNIQFKDVSLKKVISEIEKQSEFVIIYDDEVWGLLNKRVRNFEVKNKNIREVLNKILSVDEFAYTINDRQVVIHKREGKPLEVTEAPVLQTRTISGTILDEGGMPVPGVNILVVGTKRGTQTDFDGLYNIKADKGEVIEFSFVGMETQRVTVVDKDVINLTLKEDAAALDEVVVVAFGEQKKESVVASITTIKPSELKIPSSNLTTALAGRVSGLISYQRSGEPGADNAEFFVRGISTFGQGASPLILLDGFEISANELSRVQPDDIASFSVMKDATATSLYGARGANGVILITTKEGKEGKAQISFRHETSFSRPTQIPQVVGGVEYMELYNQAQFNDDPLLPKFYNVQRIENTKNGLNPYAFPDVNWYDELFKSQTVNSRYNINVTGGGKVATYYLAGSYTSDNGLLRVDKKNNFNSNIQINNYNLRSNLNIKLSPKTTVGLKISSDFNRSNTPTSSGTAIYNSVMAINPVEFPKYYAADPANEFTTHILFGNSSTATSENLFTNPYAESVKGFKDYFSATVLSQLSIKSEITKNLTFSGNFSIQSFGEFSSSRSYDPFYYRYKDYDQITDTYTLEQINDDGSAALSNPSVSRNSNSRNYFEARLLYNKTFDEKHAVSGLLVGRAEEKMNQSAGSGIYATLPSRNNGISGRLTYGYDSRYLIEANFGYNGSEKFSEKERYGFFPAIGFGYLMSNEEYWKGLEDVVNTMKLKFTYGLVGNDAITSAGNRFFFLSQISNSGNGYTWGSNYQTSYSGYTVERYANNLITWEVAEKFNLGVEMKILNAINLNVDFFKENRSDVYLTRDFIPNSVGLSAAIYGNVGEATSQGIDGSLDFNHSFTPDLWLSGRSTFTFAKSKIIEDEKQYLYDYQDRKGASIKQAWGLVAERLFVDQAEIENSPVQEFGPYQAGDIKYKDINGDGLINSNDAVAIGDPTSPEIIYGFGLSGGYKAFDLSFFFQGSAKSSFFIDSQKVAPFVGRRNALDIVADDYWNLNNPNPEAFWPRLSTTVVDNNTQQSTWWLRDGDFLRLKSLEVGYTIPEKILTRFHLEKFRVYASATNLLTISKFDLWDIEMGGNGLGYPVQRVFNVGLQLSL
ncbi:SusC/RagA family TonB-linked outer membrane protein [Algibacter miyuki]|uniref:SusC/RagA family TonB-linked outer membrane protein n=1 Tax=Algibacter miyuki TaxID=1306933 RepID=A0ABV5H3F9_9FLAO|nr:SusC/RagA family TonB-linked outer membrane protein [Algibacter miyuki]MDN3665359.1 SusC/RagA family TonB-linked outer membrane protein [Algibacter miyuki]